MPQAPDELRSQFGIADGPVIQMLQSRGYKLSKAWEWIVPLGHQVTPYERRAMCFLCLEWDFGLWWYSELREEW